jgi:hypothetical protein
MTTPYRFDHFRNIKDVHFGGPFAWSAVITAGELDNGGGANYNIYGTTPISPYYQSTFDTRTYDGYTSVNDTVQKTQLPYDSPSSILIETAFGTVDAQPIEVGTVDPSISSLLSKMRVDRARTEHILTGPSDIRNFVIAFMDDGTIASPDDTLFTGKYLHIRAGSDTTDDPPTDVTSTSATVGSVFHHTGDGLFNRGTVHYFFISPALIDTSFLFVNGSQYTLLFNDTPGVV